MVKKKLNRKTEPVESFLPTLGVERFFVFKGNVIKSRERKRK